MTARLGNELFNWFHFRCLWRIGRSRWRVGGCSIMIVRNDNRIKEIGAGAAVLFRHTRAEKSLFTNFFPDAARRDSLFFPCLDMRDNFSVEKLSQAFTEYPVPF